MKKLLPIIAYLNLLFCLSTCRDRNVDPFSDGQPRIRSISFPSIPAQNVSIDQKNFIITVKLPDQLTVSDLTPTVVVTDSARVSRLNGFKVPGFLCQSNQTDKTLPEIPLVRRNDPRQDPPPVAQYKVKFVSTGPLALNSVTQPFVHILGVGNDIDIPFLNLYANPTPLRVRFTNLSPQAPGDTLSISGTLYTGCSSKVNHFEVSVGNLPFQPGSYRIDVQKGDGTYVSASQPLLVQKGPATVLISNENRFGYRVGAGKKIAASGHNLFYGDVDLYLIDRQDRMIPLPRVDFESTGRKVTVQLPEGTPAGAYVLQMWHFKKPTSDCFRGTIPADENNNLTFSTIGDYLHDCSISTPVLLPREKSIGINHSEATSPYSRLKLTSLTTGSVNYYVPIKEFSYSNPAFPPSVTIPISVPAGRYTASVQVLGSATGQVLRESEPYGRVIELQ